MKTRVFALLFTLVLPAVLPPTGMAQTFQQTNFAATHNSYSGGSRGTIEQQLDAGVRFIEYDINNDDFETVGDYRIGHGSPGSQVDHTPPNPSTNNLAAWLQMLAGWSDQNPGHAPITLGLDWKGDLPDTPQEGNLTALNLEVAKWLGRRLYTAAELTQNRGWPQTTALNGRILVVLSGSEEARELYLADQGRTPAVGLSPTGQVVEVHSSAPSGSGLWYWSGRYLDDGKVVFTAHGAYDQGQTPAVAVGPGGVVVEVHQSQSNSGLWSHVGQIGEGGIITWGKSQNFASGSRPTVAFAADGSLTVEEIHQNNGNQLTTGTVDPQALQIRWNQPVPTTRAPFPTTSATVGDRRVSVTASPDSAGSATLFYSTPQVSRDRIRYAQELFVEFQKGNSSTLEAQNLAFYAASAGSNTNRTWASTARQAGKVVRLWGFTQTDSTNLSSPINFPATDTPYEGWYVTYCQTIACDK